MEYKDLVDTSIAFIEFELHISLIRNTSAHLTKKSENPYNQLNN